jgi:hypothetical protein
MGFDQMMIFFDKFVVVRSECSATFTNPSTSGPLRAVIRVDATNSVVTDTEQTLEVGGYVTDVCSVAPSSGATKILRAKVDVARFAGVNPSAITANSSLTGSLLGSPSNGLFYHLTAWAPLGTTITGHVSYVMDFEVIFIEPRVPSSSRIHEIHQSLHNLKVRKQLEQKTV